MEAVTIKIRDDIVVPGEFKKCSESSCESKEKGLKEVYLYKVGHRYWKSKKKVDFENERIIDDYQWDVQVEERIWLCELCLAKLVLNEGCETYIWKKMKIIYS